MRTAIPTLTLAMVAMALAAEESSAQDGGPTCADSHYPTFFYCVQAQIMQPAVVCIADYEQQTYVARCRMPFLPPAPPNCQGETSDFWHCVGQELNNGLTCEIWAEPGETGIVFNPDPARRPDSARFPAC